MTQDTLKSCPEVVVDLYALGERRPIRVLHVDDEFSLLKIARECLEMNGPFTVDNASSVDGALGKLKQEKYDAVVSDFQMPGKDGLEFLKELRHSGNSIPFIMFTGKGREEVAIKAWNMGADHYVNKSGDPETVYCELAHCIRSTVEKHKAEARERETTQKLRAIYENAVEGISFVDPAENFVYVNKAFADILGCSEEKLVGMNLHGFVSEENWARIRSETESRLTGKISRYELVFHRPDGTTRDVQISGSPLFDSDGGFAGTVGIVLDITERKKNEEALKESEAKFRSLVEQSHQGILVAQGPLPHAVFVNKSLIDMLGYTAQEFACPEKVAKIVPKEDLALFSKFFKDRMEGREVPSFYECRAIRKDGSIVWLEVSSGLIKCNDQPAIQLVLSDVTYRKKTEKQLEESEKKFRMLFEGAMEAIFVADAETGILVDCNQAATELVGRTKQELVGQHQRILHPETEVENAGFSKTFNEHLGEREGKVLEDKVVTKSGEVKEVAIKGNTIDIGGKKLLQGVFRDISEQKKAERKDLENRENFKALFAGNPEAAVHVGPDFCILDVNPRFEILFGYRLDEIKGRNINDVVVPRNKIDEAYTLDCTAERDKHVSKDTIRQRKDGSLVPVFVSAAPINIEGRFLGYVAVYKDISELKKTEREMAIMNEKLRVVGGLTRHDVRNKLAVITSDIYLFKKKLADRLDIIDNLNDMQLTCDQIVRIFEFARDYERLGMEELTFVDVGAMVDKAASSFSDKKGTRVVNDCHGVTVLADSFLERLFYNLIDNSLKYGGKLTQIRIHHEQSGDGMRLIYEDNGTGISKEARTKLFTEGFTTGKGTGYGLYLIKRMVEVYGWIIEETGERGKGARFVITIPRQTLLGKKATE